MTKHGCREMQGYQFAYPSQGGNCNHQIIVYIAINNQLLLYISVIKPSSLIPFLVTSSNRLELLSLSLRKYISAMCRIYVSRNLQLFLPHFIVNCVIHACCS